MEIKANQIGQTFKVWNPDFNISRPETHKAEPEFIEARLTYVEDETASFQRVDGDQKRFWHYINEL